MAAYGALVSLKNLIDQVQLYSARQPTSLDEQRRVLLRPLFEKVCFLLEFLESYSHVGSKEVEDLENRIVDTAYAAEVVIELHIVDDIQARCRSHVETTSSTNHSSSRLQKLMQYIDSLKNYIFEDKKNKESNLVTSTSADPAKKRCSDLLSQGLQRVIRDVDLIEKEAMEIKEKSSSNGLMRVHQQFQDLGSLRLVSKGKDSVVGLDDNLDQIMDKLTGDQPSLHIVPITGMGGIGKTTLAKYVYENSYIEQCFDIRGWVTVSQDYDARQMFLDLLPTVGVITGQNEQENPEVRLYKHLWGRRYLIVVDDIWSIEAWEKLKMFLPDNKNKSRVLVTTRLSRVANSLGPTEDLHTMNLLDANLSWSLFCSTVFGQEGCCPVELEQIGKIIVENCKGLPLSIRVIAGLLAKSSMVREYWEYVAKNVSAIVNSEDSERCLRILSLSYNHLPVHLKPCFLYMGCFREDLEIHVSVLIKKWVAEGFLRPCREKSLEEVGKEYLEDLIDRNLLYVTRFRATGSIKWCKIHDVLRDLSLREAEKQKFICVTAPYMRFGFKSKDQIVCRDNMPYRKQSSHEASRDFRSLSYLRLSVNKFITDQALSFDFRLLRILNYYDMHYPEVVSKLVNSRYIHLPYYFETNNKLFSSYVCLAWNLQTIIIEGQEELSTFVPPSEIWEMRELRHVMIWRLSLPNPRCGNTIDRPEDEFVMENFQTLRCVRDFRCTEEVVRRIPNIKKLRVWYSNKDDLDLSEYCLNNLGRLHKLESLVCMPPDIISLPPRTDLLRHLTFPLSLKKLSLYRCIFEGEDMVSKIGSLQNLEKLYLLECLIGEEWNPIEGQFLGLKVLEMVRTYLIRWTVESSHFPRLEHVILMDMPELEEVPLGIGEIQTLRTIQLTYCSDAVVASAENILEEQQSFGNEDLRLVIGSRR